MTGESRASHSDLVERARELLANRGRCLGNASRLGPELCYGRHRGPAGFAARRAAVVALLYPREGVWHLPLILRPASMNDHAGQVSLPGGGSEPGESAAQCALRELEEELGVRPDQLEIIGQLAPILVFASNFHVTPFVAAAEDRPEFRPCPSEVAEMYEVPAADILDRRRWGQIAIKRGRLEFRAPSFVHQGRHIWGATGSILTNLGSAIGELFQ